MATSTFLAGSRTPALSAASPSHGGMLGNRASRSIQVTVGSNAAMPRGVRQTKETLVKSDMEWPLPCPAVNFSEPEGQASRTGTEITSLGHNAAACDSAAPHSTMSRSQGVEIKVGLAKVAKFTPEKARLLRQKTRESDSHHDLMYHSGLAARLA